MISRLYLSVILGFAAALWAVLLIVEGVTVDIIWLRPFSVVVGVLLLVILAFDLWLWRIPFLHGWFVKRPNLCGTWQIELNSEWKDPETGKSPKPIDAYLVARQTFSRLSLRLLTKESSSEVLGTDVVEAPDGTFRVYAVYRNEPKLEVRDRSPIHYGGLLLAVEGYPVERLVGHYWTDRNSRGQLVSKHHSKTICSSFDAAVKLGVSNIDSVEVE